MKAIILLAIFSAGLAHANPRPHKAHGRHVCQSQISLGHSCENFGINFMDCHQAFYSLKAEDCCRNTESGGYSIEFQLLKCSSFYRLLRTL